MIYDFTKGKSALYFSSLMTVDYNFEFNEFILNQEDLEYDHIGFVTKSKKNGMMRLGIFLPEFNNIQFGKNPVLHIFNCDTTEDLSRNMKVTCSTYNTFFSRDAHKNISTNLELCKKCVRNLRKKHNLRLGVNNFNNFILGLEESDRRQTIIDADGYIINWRQVSYCYRDTKNFTCEKCGFKAKDMAERKFLHTHHIDKVKINNKRDNLQCLCIKCHSEVDEHHRKKFAFEGLSQLSDFLRHKDNRH